MPPFERIMSPALPHWTPPSRLPHLGTTIFTSMSVLAQQHRAVNLGQGFPDFECDPRLIECVHEAMRQGFNQYAPMPGLLLLREILSAQVENLYGRTFNPHTEITITAGATQAIFTALLSIVHPGDEIIVLTPCYDSYEPNILLAGGRVVHVPLRPGTFRPDFPAISAALTPRTRALIINSPHNPTGTVWSAEEMETLSVLLRPTSTLLISDEVYEHMVFDGQRHQSVSRWPDLAERSFVISSFGKTLHVTGWKVGFMVAPEALSAEFRKVHQFNVFCVNSAIQQGLAAYLKNFNPTSKLAPFYQAKRDFFLQGLRQTRFKPLPCEGSYFQCVNYAEISDDSEEAFCVWLTEKIGVAAIPISAFYPDRQSQQLARLCFAKKQDTLEKALDKLSVL
jgi:methionine aminotransferase